MYDVFFLSHEESYAERALTNLRAQHPLVRHVSGIDGINNAHRRCAELASTKHFFVVDADNEITSPDVFSYQVPDYDAQYVHLWYAANPLVGITYGWGGVKLFPRGIIDDRAMPLDLTTTFPLKIIPEVVSVSRFNTSGLETWRSAFREAVKLSQQDGDEADNRLYRWCNPQPGNYTEECRNGAREGYTFGDAARGDAEQLSLINDYRWLERRYYERE